MIDNSIEILKFNADNFDEYNVFLKSERLPKEFDILSCQTLSYQKTIYIFYRLLKRKMLFLSKNKKEFLGYCIVDNAIPYFQETGMKGDYFSINREILEYAPVAIVDFMINKRYRRQGFGTKFANYIVYDVYKSENLSLHADGDGLYFWDKIGFKFVEGFEPNMVLLRN